LTGCTCESEPHFSHGVKSPTRDVSITHASSPPALSISESQLARHRLRLILSASSLSCKRQTAIAAMDRDRERDRDRDRRFVLSEASQKHQKQTLLFWPCTTDVGYLTRQTGTTDTPTPTVRAPLDLALHAATATAQVVLRRLDVPRLPVAA
jgi:hypothetical protein